MNYGFVIGFVEFAEMKGLKTKCWYDFLCEENNNEMMVEFLDWFNENKMK